MKIAFFGTSDRSLPILEILNDNFELKMCVTKANTRVGRRQKIKETGVKSWCKANRVDFIEIISLSGLDLEEVLQSLKARNIEFGVVADFSYIIPGPIINYFDNKLINIHFSLLPKYRGASPVQFAILNDDKITGITYQLIHPQLDRGNILEQFEYKLPNNFSSKEVYDELFQLSAQKLPNVINKYSNNELKPVSQDENLATYTYSRSHPRSTLIFKEDAQINWKNSAKIIYNQVRAYNPWPIAWTFIKDMPYSFKESVNKELKVKIYRAALQENELQINDIQVEGKSKIDWKSFKNGYLA